LRQYLGIPEIVLFTLGVSPAMHLGDGSSFIPDTNVIERLHEEFRRRVKTQGSLPTEDAALVLLFGLVAGGQIRFRRVDGWRQIPAVLSQQRTAA
jgi:hypothetical protein